MKDLLHKGVKTVQNTMKRGGYIVACDYEDGDNYVVEFAKVAAGVTVKSVTIIFNSNWRVTEVK